MLSLLVGAESPHVRIRNAFRPHAFPSTLACIHSGAPQRRSVTLGEKTAPRHNRGPGRAEAHPSGIVIAPNAYRAQPHCCAVAGNTRAKEQRPPFPFEQSSSYVPPQNDAPPGRIVLDFLASIAYSNARQSNWFSTLPQMLRRRHPDRRAVQNDKLWTLTSGTHRSVFPRLAR
jgi:hypothetical protein